MCRTQQRGKEEEKIKRIEVFLENIQIIRKNSLSAPNVYILSVFLHERDVRYSGAKHIDIAHSSPADTC